MNIKDLELSDITADMAVICGEKKNDADTRHLCDVFFETADRYPDRPALAAGSEYTYRELRQKVMSCAAYLYGKGVRAGDRVAITGSRNAETIAGIYAILCLRAAYVPIDMEYPPERVKYICEQSGAKFIVVTGDTGSGFGEGTEVIDISGGNYENSFADFDEKIIDRSEPDPVIYIIFTSGTTGAPKGTAIRNNGIMNLCHWYADTLGLIENSRLMFLYSFGFDSSIKNIFSAYLTGAELILGPEQLYDAGKISDICRQYRPTHLNSVPKLLELILDYDKKNGNAIVNGLEMIIPGGEALTKHMFEGLPADIRMKVLNTYGPTECTSVNTFMEYSVPEILAAPTIAIGRPVYNKIIAVTDENGEILRKGEKGELLITGTGVSDGYINRETDSFIYGGKYGIIYRTGDICYISEKDIIEFCGRNDSQVKINGHRIELMEIKNCAEKLETVKWFEPKIVDIGGGNQCFAGYVKMEEGGDASSLKQELSKWLPDYMIPGDIIEIDEIPLTVNGKTDFAKLRDVLIGRINTAVSTEGLSDNEKKLRDIWRSIVGRSDFRRSDRFFDVGGNSIKLFEMKMKISEGFGKDIDIAQLLEAASLENILALIEKNDTAEKKDEQKEQRMNVNARLNERLARMKKRRK